MIKYITEPNQEFEDSLVWLQKQHVVGVDTECTGLNPLTDTILLLQIGDTSTQYVYDTFRLGDEHIKKVLTYLTTSSIISIMQNAIYDYSMIKSNYGFEVTNLKDTIIAHRLLTSGRVGARSGLKDLLQKFFNIPIDKTTGKDFIKLTPGDSFSETQIRYAAHDVKHLIPLEKKLSELLKEAGMEKLAELEYATIPVTAEMQLTGVYIDQKKWLALSDKAEEKLIPIEEELYQQFEEYCVKDMFGDLLVPNSSKSKAKKLPLTKLNYASPIQLKTLLEKVLGFEIENTEEATLSQIDHPVIPSVIKYRKLSKLITTYGKAFIEEHVFSDNRIHTTFNQLKADSGRYASENPNLQNIPGPDVYREPFCVDNSDYKFVCADFSGQELRLLAHISQEPKFIQALKEGKDLHAYSASLLFQIDYKSFFWTDLTTDEILIDRKGKPIFIDEMEKKYRTPAKEITFGLIYGMGPYKLAQKLEIDVKTAIELRKKYFIIFPQIKGIMDDFTQFVRTNHYAISPLDRRRRDLTQLDWLDEAKVAGAINQAKNLPFQGAGASVTKLAMCRIHKLCKKNNWDAKIILTIHDEIIMEVHKDIAKEISDMMEKQMIDAFNYYAPSVPMEVTAVVSDHWVH